MRSGSSRKQRTLDADDVQKHNLDFNDVPKHNLDPNDAPKCDKMDVGRVEADEIVDNLYWGEVIDK